MAKLPVDAGINKYSFRLREGMHQHRILEHPIIPVRADVKWVEFTFNGKRMMARENEVLSSALFANGVHTFGHHHRDGSPQGIFCANGQCAQCLVLVDGVARKACITPVREGMDVRSPDGLPELKPEDHPVKFSGETPEFETDVLVIGGGPAGLMGALELAAHGVRCILCDDKHAPGGKLTLQTHNFFGSVRECYAGERGINIAAILEKQVRDQKNIQVWTNSPAVGVFVDGRVGIVKEGVYTLVKPKGILIATGAREKTLAFPGADLPGVYGAGAFQTLVNRDLIKPAERILIVGGGNVGLIAAYHALQAGMDVVALVEALPECGGYKVHKDKLLRLGVPVYTSHTILRASGKGHVESVIITGIDSNFRPIPGSEAEFDVDTILIAVGLSPVNELSEMAKRAGMKVYHAGDAEEIAEASAAMFSGRIAARRILKDMGVNVDIPEEWHRMLCMLRARPGRILGSYPVPPGLKLYPVIRCPQEIPCNPCTEVCPKKCIVIPEGNILGRPRFEGGCIGCMRCVAVCPGLAITLVDRRHDPPGTTARVTLPWEMPEGVVKEGDEVTLTGGEGELVGRGKVIRIEQRAWTNRRRLLTVEVPAGICDQVAGIRIREPLGRRVPTAVRPCDDGEVIVCRCERVTRKRIIEYIQKTGARDFNAVKAGLRCGMGPCGGKTCTELIMRIFREMGINPASVEPHVVRPFTQEVPITSFLGGGEDE